MVLPPERARTAGVEKHSAQPQFASRLFCGPTTQAAMNSWQMQLTEKILAYAHVNHNREKQDVKVYEVNSAVGTFTGARQLWNKQTRHG